MGYFDFLAATDRYRDEQLLRARLDRRERRLLAAFELQHLGRLRFEAAFVTHRCCHEQRQRIQHERDTPEPTELKRMWVASSARGLGLGRRLLAELESEAFRHGAKTIRLETNRALSEAIALYRSSGYREVDAFNEEPYAHHWFEKRLG